MLGIPDIVIVADSEREPGVKPEPDLGPEPSEYLHPDPILGGTGRFLRSCVETDVMQKFPMMIWSRIILPRAGAGV